MEHLFSSRTDALQGFKCPHNWRTTPAPFWPRPLAVAKMPLPYGYQIANLRLEAGQLVLFPSWVLHDVKPFEGEGERITVAFNCWFTLPEQASE